MLTQEKKYPKGEEFIEVRHARHAMLLVGTRTLTCVPRRTFMCVADSVPLAMRTSLTRRDACALRLRRRTCGPQDLMGDSVFNTDGEHWRLQRKMSSKGFSREMMREHMMPVIVDQCALLMQRLRTVAVRGEVFDMQAVCQQFTLDVMCEILYGVRIGSMNGKNMPYSQAVDIAEDLSFKRFFLPDWKILRRFNIGRERKMKRAMQTINGEPSTHAMPRRPSPPHSPRHPDLPPPLVTHRLRLQDHLCADSEWQDR